ncbi:hypothetical protein BJX99DRAFT_261433 [Aspergillus californicus]
MSQPSTGPQPLSSIPEETTTNPLSLLTNPATTDLDQTIRKAADDQNYRKHRLCMAYISKQWRKDQTKLPAAERKKTRTNNLQSPPIRRRRIVRTRRQAGPRTSHGSPAPFLQGFPGGTGGPDAGADYILEWAEDSTFHYHYTTLIRSIVREQNEGMLRHLLQHFITRKNVWIMTAGGLPWKDQDPNRQAAYVEALRKITQSYESVLSFCVSAEWEGGIRAVLPVYLDCVRLQDDDPWFSTRRPVFIQCVNDILRMTFQECLDFFTVDVCREMDNTWDDYDSDGSWKMVNVKLRIFWGHHLVNPELRTYALLDGRCRNDQGRELSPL